MTSSHERFNQKLRECSLGGIVGIQHQYLIRGATFLMSVDSRQERHQTGTCNRQGVGNSLKTIEPLAKVLLASAV